MNAQSEAAESLALALEQLDLARFFQTGDDLATERDHLVRTIRTYLEPRLADPTGPLRVVFAGPTGSGKSTLINTLTNLDLSPAGVLRPTTSEPVVLTSSEHAEQAASVGGIDCRVVVGGAPILAGMCFVDTPDIDSAATRHRAIAETLIDNSDVVVFVTSALRYADAVPWQVLRRAEARGGVVIHVLNRVSSATAGAVVDFKSRLRNAGLSDEVLVVHEHHTAVGAQRIPSTSVRDLARHLLGVSEKRRNEADAVIRRVFASTLERSVRLAWDVDAELERRREFEQRLIDEVQGRVGGVNWAGVTEGAGESLQLGPTPRAIRRWRRSGRRLTAEDVEARHEVIVKRMVAVALGELRRFIVGTDAVAHLDPESFLSPLRHSLESAADGWLQYVRRMIDEGDDGGEAWLASVVLMRAVTEGGLGAAEGLFGGDAGAMVERASRELTGRMEVAFAVVASALAESVHGPSDDSDLARVEAALNRLQPAVTVDA